MTTDRFLIILLRINAGVLLLAAPCALVPFAWMDALHRDALGLGSLPDIPITRYMARSLSLVYAMHGAVILVVTLDWGRYKPLVPILALLHVGFGFAMLAVDLSSGLPWWWTAIEGPSLAGFGLLVFAVYLRTRRASCGTSGV
jgi:hypothetical protein